MVSTISPYYFLLHDYRGGHIGMDLAMIWEATRLVEGITKSLTGCQVSAIPNPGIAGDGVSDRIIICPGHCRAFGDGQSLWRKSKTRDSHR